MVIDSSALIAILRLEPEADAFLDAIVAADRCLLSAVNLLETSMVLSGTSGNNTAWQPLDELVSQARIEIVPFDQPQAEIARSAFARFGKGRHPARLNFADCAAYALAASRIMPLLCKGDDFRHTDIETAPATV